MLQRINQPNRASMLLNLGVALGATFVINGLIFGLGWNASTDTLAARASFAPPDWVVGAAWVVWLGLLAVARWWLNASVRAEAVNARNWVGGLLVSCLLWPLYSLAIGSLVGGLIGNLWTIALAAFTIFQISKLSKTDPHLALPAGSLVAPVILWVSYATAIILRQLGVL
jgi:tryptophan-rich sensory protein